MMIVKGFIRKYQGAFMNEEEAARVYDKYAVYLWGKSAQVNFPYDKGQILELLDAQSKETM